MESNQREGARWTNYSLPVRKPTIDTDGGPFTDHDQACAVCRARHAVMVLDGWRFEPCWGCQERGWRLVRATGLRARLISLLSEKPYD